MNCLGGEASVKMVKILQPKKRPFHPKRSR